MLINVVLEAGDSSSQTGYEEPEIPHENNQCAGHSEICEPHYQAQIRRISEIAVSIFSDTTSGLPNLS
jgi:hypothetical protein